MRPTYIELLERIASEGNEAVRGWLDDWYELERAREALRVMAERVDENRLHIRLRAKVTGHTVEIARTDWN